MYKEFLEAVLAYITALNDASEKINEVPALTPYVGHIPVLIDNCLCGFIVDEIGGQFSYREAEREESDWWDARPWAKKKRTPLALDVSQFTKLDGGGDEGG